MKDIICNSTSDYLFIAKIAELSERYEDMFKQMKKVMNIENSINKKER